jgi:hypothetical protein
LEDASLPHQTEHTDQDSTVRPDEGASLPLPELNPLLNPLLGRHMGRWAEVYFTAAPENRDEAVLALLHQLESEAATEPQKDLPEAPVADNNSGNATPDLPPKPAWTRTFDQTSPTCESCGAHVPKTQRFCGMCGARLATEFSSRTNTYDDINDSDNYEEPAEEFYSERTDFGEPVFSFGGNVAADNHSVPYRYRAYVGAALVILFAALAVMARRSAQDWLGSSHSLPQAAPAREAPPATQPPPNAEAAPPVSKAENPAVPIDADGKATPKTESRENRAETPAKAPANNASPVGSNPAPSSSNQGNGSAELSVAERYLNGAHGNTRDSSEAARWLWQAVSKKNAAAALLLSDLYLRGDGVPKSCDQARLLLDAAASKGLAGAGERLRNLQAFGCQ